MAISIRTIKDINTITSSLYKCTGKVLQEFIKDTRLNSACHEGCDVCCKTMRVEILPSEAFYLAAKIKEIFSPEQLEQLLQKLAINDKKLKGKTLLQSIDEHARCPFLETGRCIVYEYRPYKCRAFLAKDSIFCLTDQCKTKQVPELDPFLEEHGNIQKYFKTLRENNLDAEPAEMSNALHKILTDTTIEARFFDKEHELFDKLKHV